MTIEDRLRDAMNAATETVEPDAGGWERIQAGVAAQRRWRLTRTTALSVLGAAAAAVLVVATLPLFDADDNQAIEVGPADSTVTTEAPTTTGATVTTSTVPPTDELFPGIWPYTTQQEVDAIASDEAEWVDPLVAATDFAEQYLGMVDPIIVEGGWTLPRNGATGGAVIQTRPNGPLTRVSLVMTVSSSGARGPWVVTGATTDNIVVDAPATGDGIASPVSVTGQASAFEGNVLVEVKEDGMLAGERLGQAPVTGNGGPELGPFAGDIPFDTPSAPAGAVVFSVFSAEDGSLQEATVVRVGFGTGAATTELTVYFEAPNSAGCGQEVTPISRTVPQTTGVLRASLEQLLAGPTEEERSRGVVSVFGGATAGLLRDVTIDAEGAAVVDFADFTDINNISTSCNSGSLLAELDATVFQFPSVTSVEYRMEGSCDAFFGFLQYGCEVRRG